MKSKGYFPYYPILYRLYKTTKLDSLLKIDKEIHRKELNFQQQNGTNFKPIQEDSMAINPKHITNNRLDTNEHRFYFDVSYEPESNRYEIYLDKFYVWIYPDKKTFEIMDYGD